MIRSTINSDKGSVVLLVLLVLMLVSMFGISALNSSSTELMISRNGRCYKQNIYRAESAIMEISKFMEDDSDPNANFLPASSPHSWLTDGSTNSPAFEPESTDWVFSGLGSNASYSSLYTDKKAGYTVVFEGLAPGHSYNMDGPNMWQYGIYGMSQLCDGSVGVVAGYKKRF